MLKKILGIFKRKNKKTPEIKSDVLGSYTGVTINPFEIPEQDADDL